MTVRLYALACLLGLSGCAGLLGGPAVNSTTATLRFDAPPAAVLDTVAAALASLPDVAVQRSGAGLRLRDTRPGQDNRAVVTLEPADGGTTRVLVSSQYRARDGFWDLPGRVVSAVRERGLAHDVEPALSSPLGCQSGPAPPDGERPEPAEDYHEAVVEVPPELVGGLEGLAAVVRYPEAARRRGVEGTVLVQFVVDETGAIGCVNVLVSPDAAMSAEAVRALGTRAFRPGTQRGVPVSVRYSLPIAFRLR